MWTCIRCTPAPTTSFDSPGLWEALHQQVAKGKIRQLGVSLGGDDVDQARRVDQVGAGVVQGRLQPPGSQRRARGLAGLSGAGLGGDRPGAAGQRLPERRLSAGRLGHRPRRLALGSRPGRGPGQAGVGRGASPDRGTRGDGHGPVGHWLVPAASRRQHPAVSGVVAGARWSVEQVQSNAAAADLDLIRGITPRLWCRSRDQAHSPELPCQCADQPRVAPKTRPRA
jgi:hypothetical protein